MTLKKIIKSAIKGGWELEGSGRPFSFSIDDETNLVDFIVGYNTVHSEDHWTETVSIEKILLDPKFWQAASKTERWKECTTDCEKYSNHCSPFHFKVWKKNMLGLPQALIDGKTIKEYLKTL